MPPARRGPCPAAAAEPSFDALVTAVTRDLRPRAVLDEWLSRGLVRLDAEERVVLNAAAYLPRPGGAEQLFYFGRNLHDHIAAAAANVLADGPAPFLDRSVHYDALPAPLADDLAALARQAAERALLDINRAALARLEGVAPAPGPTRRVNLGVFLYVEDEPPGEDELAMKGASAWLLAVALALSACQGAPAPQRAGVATDCRDQVERGIGGTGSAAGTGASRSAASAAPARHPPPPAPRSPIAASAGPELWAPSPASGASASTGWRSRSGPRPRSASTVAPPTRRRCGWARWRRSRPVAAARSLRRTASASPTP